MPAIASAEVEVDCKVCSVDEEDVDERRQFLRRSGFGVVGSQSRVMMYWAWRRVVDVGGGFDFGMLFQ